MTMKVLVVEDDFLIAEDYRSIIEARGWQVIGPAATDSDGLALLQTSAPDVALLDLILKRSLSTPVAEALHSLEIPFIIASACEDPVAIGGEVFRGKFNLGKPSRPGALIKALEDALVTLNASRKRS